MNPVIPVSGLVKYRITLDPSIWIIDDRKFPLSERIDGAEGLAVELGTFLRNAEPEADATHVIVHRDGKEPAILPMNEAMSALMCFAKDGKPIREGGPVLLYLADGSNRECPVDSIVRLEAARIENGTAGGL